MIDRNLHTQDPKVQTRAINKGDKEKQMDGIGDTVVTLICISEQLGLKFNDCLDYAYNDMEAIIGKNKLSLLKTEKTVRPCRFCIVFHLLAKPTWTNCFLCF